MCSNPQDGAFDFVRDENYMQAQFVDLTEYFDKELIQQSVTDRGAKSKVAMKCGDVFLDGFEDKHAPICITSVVDAGPQRGVTNELLSKVWRIFLYDAKQTLQVTTQLNKQDAHSDIVRCFSSNN